MRYFKIIATVMQKNGAKVALLEKPLKSLLTEFIWDQAISKMRMIWFNFVESIYYKTSPF